MRLSQARYERDEQRLRLARQLVRYDARSTTIERWTGISQDRARRLFRTYEAVAPGQRKRGSGPTPSRLTYFLATAQRERETAWLASLLTLAGVIPYKPTSIRDSLDARMAYIDKMGKAYGAYREWVANPSISFERSLLLTEAVAHGNQLRLATCTECESLIVVDAQKIETPRCVDCRR